MRFSWCCMARSRCARPAIVEPIAELRAGELVGEIGFFANVPRTADVIAIRDTSVLALTRPAYQKLVEEAPAIVEALLAALARRFARETARIAPFPASPKARTVALIDGGTGAGAGRFRSPDARGARGDRCRDRRCRPPAGDVSRPRARCARSHRMAQPARTHRAAGGLSRRPRRLAMGAQGDPSGRHGGVRVPRRGARRRADRDRSLCLRGSSRLGPAPRPRS